MANPTTIHEVKPSLNDMVYCANCSTAMAKTDQHYYCPSNSADSRRNCPTKPVQADHLRYTVINELINRLVTDDALQAIVEGINETTNANAPIQRQRMEQAEAAIAEANAKRTAFLQLVENGDKTYKDVAADIDELDRTTAGFAFESIVARNELEKIAFVCDEQGIRDTATSVDTWLGGNNPEEAQELLDLLVQKVTVGSESALIVYHAPMPAADHPEGVTEDLVELYPNRNA